MYNDKFTVEVNFHLPYHDQPLLRAETEIDQCIALCFARMDEIRGRNAALLEMCAGQKPGEAELQKRGRSRLAELVGAMIARRVRDALLQAIESHDTINGYPRAQWLADHRPPGADARTA